MARAIRFATGADQAWHRLATGQGLRRAPWRALRCSAASDKCVSRSAASLATVAVIVGWAAILPLSRAEAQTNWTGAASNDWNTAGNWFGGLPTGNITTTIDTITTNPTVLNGGTGTTADLTVGSVGTGALTIQNGAILTSSNGANSNIIGDGASSTGTVTVDGAGSTWAINSSGTTLALFAGNSGKGALTIQNGGVVSDSRSLDIGTFAGSTGTVTVDGAGSTLNSGVLFVGEQGAGTMTVRNGGSVGGSSQAIIGDNAGSTGTVTVDGVGSTLTSGNVLFVDARGTGTLTISNGGTVSTPGVEIAGFAGSSGMVTVDGAGSALTSGDLISVGVDGTGSLTIANGGLVSATAVGIASTAGSTGTLNLGAATGAAPAAPGTLDTPVVFFGAGSGTIVFNHTSSNYVFAPEIDGNGAVNVLAGTTILTAANTYTGPTLINGGALVVDGSIVSPTTVNAGGTLAGIGAVGATSVANGGTLSPGHNGIGTLTVNGNLAFAKDAIYLFGVSGVSSGFTNVTGTATLTGATASAQFQGTTFANKYTILSAAGGLGGTEFANFQTNSSAITANLTYTANDVILNLISGFTSIGGGLSGTSGLTRNQTAVAAALDNAFNKGGKSLTGLLGLSAGQLPAAFDTLSGEGISAAQQTAFGAGNVFATMMMDQGAFWRGGAAADRADHTADPNGVTYAPLGYASEKPASGPFAAMPAKAPLFEQRWRGWVAGFDGTSSLRGEADPGSASQRERIAAAAAGLDYQVNPDLLVGAAAGGSTSSFSVPDRSTSGNLQRLPSRRLRRGAPGSMVRRRHAGVRKLRQQHAAEHHRGRPGRDRQRQLRQQPPERALRARLAAGVEWFLGDPVRRAAVRRALATRLCRDRHGVRRRARGQWPELRGASCRLAAGLSRRPVRHPLCAGQRHDLVALCAGLVGARIRPGPQRQRIVHRAAGLRLHRRRPARRQQCGKARSRIETGAHPNLLAVRKLRRRVLRPQPVLRRQGRLQGELVGLLLLLPR